MNEATRALRSRWIRSGDPTDEAAWLEARVAGGWLRAERLRLAAHLGHPAALLVAARSGGVPRRRTLRAGAGQQLRQWTLGLGDVCPPAERLLVARRALRPLLRLLGFEATRRELSERLGDAPPWGAMRIVAGVAQEALSEVEEPTLVRTRLRAALEGWALAEGQEARPYRAEDVFRVGERVAHPELGDGFVRRAGTRACVVEFPRLATRLPHRRGREAL